MKQFNASAGLPLSSCFVSCSFPRREAALPSLLKRGGASCRSHPVMFVILSLNLEMSVEYQLASTFVNGPPITCEHR